MKKRYSALLISFIFLTVIIPSVISVNNLECNDSYKPTPWLITFYSYIDLEIDINPLNKPIPLNQLISVPIKVIYWTDIPDFFSNLPWIIRNLFIFQRLITPVQTINLTIKEIPDWADLDFIMSKLLFDIPFYGEEIVKNTSLLILLKDGAPAEPYTICIEAHSEAVGRINEFKYQASISFTAEYTPLIEIYGNRSIITPPNQQVDIPITVKNIGNKISRITPTLINNFDDWLPLIEPSFVELNVNASFDFVLSVTAPNNYNDVEVLEIDFVVEKYPYHVNSTVGHFPYYIFLHYP
jgi:hypothetical protein